MKISAIVSDYDGTLAPEDASLESSKVPKEIEDALLRLASSIPVAMVTSKDFGFIHPRTRFASAWACVSGLEIVLNDGRGVLAARANAILPIGLEYAKGRDRFGLKFELKRATTEELLGFSIDWRRGTTPSGEFIQETTSELTRLGLTVIYDPTRPFLDVFGDRPDKGKAVRKLRNVLKISGNILFLGDSVSDNPAFEDVEAAICVTHGQSLESLTCEFALRQDELGGFFQSLADNGLSLDLRTLRHR